MKSSGHNLQGDDFILKNPKTLKNILLKHNSVRTHLMKQG